MNEYTNFHGQYANRTALFRHRLAELTTQVAISYLLVHRVMWVHSMGMPVDNEAAILKVFVGELSQQIANTGLNLLGLYGSLERNSQWARIKGFFSSLLFIM